MIAAGLEGEPQVTSQGSGKAGHGVAVSGHLINLFDADLSEASTVIIEPGTRAFLLDANYFKLPEPRILAASAKISDEHLTPSSLVFHVTGIDQTDTVMRILSATAPKSVKLDNNSIDATHYQYNGRTVLIRFNGSYSPHEVHIEF